MCVKTNYTEISCCLTIKIIQIFNFVSHLRIIYSIPTSQTVDMKRKGDGMKYFCNMQLQSPSN
jgi:hypothetical protein